MSSPRRRHTKQATSLPCSGTYLSATSATGNTLLHLLTTTTTTTTTNEDEEESGVRGRSLNLHAGLGQGQYVSLSPLGGILVRELDTEDERISR